MSIYNGPPRPGARGGRGEFSWDNVKNDKDASYYLGHSVKALTGRWQKGKDVYWYTREKQSNDPIQDEIKLVKQKEEEAMLEALGLKPKTVHQPQQPMDERELQQLLKAQQINSGAAEESEAPDPDRIKGLGYAPGAMIGGGVAEHAKLQGTVPAGGEPAAPAPGAGAAAQGQQQGGPTAASLLAMAAAGIKLSDQQLSMLKSIDKKAAKKAKKEMKKARKKAKKEEKRAKKQAKRTREEKDKPAGAGGSKRRRSASGSEDDSGSSSSSESSDDEQDTRQQQQQQQRGRHHADAAPAAPPSGRQQPHHTHRDEPAPSRGRERDEQQGNGRDGGQDRSRGHDLSPRPGFGNRRAPAGFVDNGGRRSPQREQAERRQRHDSRSPDRQQQQQQQQRRRHDSRSPDRQQQQQQQRRRHDSRSPVRQEQQRRRHDSRSPDRQQQQQQQQPRRRHDSRSPVRQEQQRRRHDSRSPDRQQQQQQRRRHDSRSPDRQQQRRRHDSRSPVHKSRRHDSRSPVRR